MIKHSVRFLITAFLSMIILFLANYNIYAYSYSLSDNKITVRLDDNILNLSNPPIVKDGITLIPLRELADIMNISIFWNPETKTVVCSKDDIYLTLTIDSRIMKSSEDKDVFLDAAPILTNGITFVPLRAISLAFGCEVFWDSEQQTVFIYSAVNTEDAVLSSKLTKLSLYIYAINDNMCLDKGSYMSLAKVLKPEYSRYEKDFEYFSEIFDTSSDSPFGKININYSSINSFEIRKAKKILNLSEDSIDVLISEIKSFVKKTGCKIPDYADYMADIELYEKYIENYTVRTIDDSLEQPYIFKEKYKAAEKPYNRHIKKMDKFKKKYLSEDPDMLIPPKEKLYNAETEAKKLLEEVKTIFINMGIGEKTFRSFERTDIKPLIKADLNLTLYLKEFIKNASDLSADKNGKTLKQKYSDYQGKYNSMYIKTLDTYSSLFKLNRENPQFSAAFDTITKMNDKQIADCVKTINQLLDEWKYLASKAGVSVF